MKKYDNYKDSGIEWIGEIPTHWEINRLKFIGDAIGGLTYSPDDIVENESEGKLVLRSSNIQNGKLSLDDNVYVNKQIPEKLKVIKGDILICSRNGSQHLIGKNICIDERTEGNTFGAFMMIFRSNNFRFLNHFFNSPIFTSQSGLFLTSTINQLTSTTLNNFYLAIPNSIEEQTTIANYLDQKTTEIEALVTKKERLIELLEEERTAIINQVVTKGLDPTVQLKDSGIEWLGEIPEHWEIKRIKNIFNSGKGLTITKENLIDEGVKCVNYGEVHSKFGFELDTETHNLRCVSPEYLEKNQKALITTGDFVFADTSEDIVGAGNFTYLKSEETIFSGYHTITLKPKVNIESRFFAFLFDSLPFRTQIRQAVKGVKVFSVTQAILKNSEIWFPSKVEQEKISQFLTSKTNEIDTIISKTQQEIDLLKEYKTALISEVVTGKIDVRNEV